MLAWVDARNGAKGIPAAIAAEELWSTFKGLYDAAISWEAGGDIGPLEDELYALELEYRYDAWPADLSGLTREGRIAALAKRLANTA